MRIRKTLRPVLAADTVFDDEDFDMDAPLEDDTIGDQIDEMQDAVDDIQDAVEDIEEDDVDIDIDNNIVDHLIAECENCKGVFISAMIASDQEVDSINGICPLCNKNTTQQLKWIIKDYPEEAR
jgi:hypothetical protein